MGLYSPSEGGTYQGRVKFGRAPSGKIIVAELQWQGKLLVFRLLVSQTRGACKLMLVLSSQSRGESHQQSVQALETLRGENLYNRVGTLSGRNLTAEDFDCL